MSERSKKDYLLAPTFFGLQTALWLGGRTVAWAREPFLMLQERGMTEGAEQDLPDNVWIMREGAEVPGADLRAVEEQGLPKNEDQAAFASKVERDQFLEDLGIPAPERQRIISSDPREQEVLIGHHD